METVILIFNQYQEVERVMIFEDKDDAVNVFFDGKLKNAVMTARNVEYYKSGELPADIPLQPKLPMDGDA